MSWKTFFLTMISWDLTSARLVQRVSTQTALQATVPSSSQVRNLLLSFLFHLKNLTCMFRSGIIKSNLSKVPTLKRKRKGPISKYARVAKELLRVTKAPNLSRSRTAALVAFPTFDKCDSLVFFASTMARCLNAADFTELRKHMTYHFDKNCLVVYKGTPLNTDTLLERLELNTELHPDMLMCARQTKVVDDTIEAKLYLKFTDIPSLYEPFARRLHGTSEQDYSPVQREVILKTKLDGHEGFTRTERESMYRMIDLREHLTVYATMHLSLRFNPRTHKVVHMETQFEFTSIQLSTPTAGALQTI
jgi:hypothetical protein